MRGEPRLLINLRVQISAFSSFSEKPTASAKVACVVEITVPFLEAIACLPITAVLGFGVHQLL